MLPYDLRTAYLGYYEVALRFLEFVKRACHPLHTYIRTHNLLKNHSKKPIEISVEIFNHSCDPELVTWLGRLVKHGAP